MQRFLVATDLSPRSEHALSRAFQLAEGREGAEIIVAHVIDEDLPHAIAQETLRQARTEIATQLKARGSSVPAEVEIVLGHAPRDIPRMAEERGADLLILGLHRPRPIADLFRDTTMERIVRAIRIPVLLAKLSEDRPWQTILAPTDFSPASANAIQTAAALAPEAEITAFHAFSIPFKGLVGGADAKGALKSFLADATAERDAWIARNALPDRCAPPELVEGGLGTVLADRVHRLHPDLVAIGAHARATAADWIIGSLAAEMMRAPPADLLIGRPDRAG
ncbi:MAG: universal stress protein [Pseudomonadota bacterium]